MASSKGFQFCPGSKKKKKKRPATGTDRRVWYYEVFYEATGGSLIMVKYRSNAEAGDSAFKSLASVPLNRLVNYFGRWLQNCRPHRTRTPDQIFSHATIYAYSGWCPPPPHPPFIYILYVPKAMFENKRRGERKEDRFQNPGAHKRSRIYVE